MPFVDLCFNLIRFERVMTSLGRHLSFLKTIVHISNSIELKNFILGTKTQQHDFHLMINLQDGKAQQLYFKSPHHLVKQFTLVNKC